MAVSDINDYLQGRFRTGILPVIKRLIDESLPAAVQYTLEPGRNRFRAVLPSVVAKMTGGNAKNAGVIGAVAEIAWTGIIIHDDIIDEDTQRRGQPAAHNQYSMNNALCGGLMAITAGVETLYKEHLDSLVRGFIQAVHKTYNGQEAHQGIWFGNTEDSLFHVYRMKTSLGVWALTSAAATGIDGPINQFAITLGVAGQIKDDLDDLFADNAYEIQCRDLREGVVNLPILLLYGHGNEADRSFLGANLGRKTDELPLSELTTRLRNLKIIEMCKKTSAEFIERAKNHLLDGYQDSDARDVLMQWAESHSVQDYE